jgi:CAF1 family ribonuclease
MKSYYTRLREAAETRQVVSIGLSCFRSSTNFTKLHPESCDPLVFTCTSFNILLFPDAEFEMDGSAKRFLVTHGFDLNRWVDAGIRYSLHGEHVSVEHVEHFSLILF